MTPRYCGCALIVLALASLGASPTAIVTAQSPRKPSEPEPIAILPADPVWTVALNGVPAAAGALDDARVYVPIKDRGLRALARDTGEPLWGEAFDVTQPPLVVEGHLLVALPEELRGLDPATGTARWSRGLPRPLAAPPTAVGPLVLIVTDAGEAMAVRAADGAIVWRRDLGAVSPYPAAAVPPSGAVLTVASRVVVLDMANGAVRWERRLPGALSAPAVARDRVLVGSTNNYFYALDLENGDERWKWRTGGDVVGAAADGDRVYFVSLDNILRAVNRDNGNQIWKAAISSRPAEPPRAFGDVVMLAGVAPRVDAFHGKTGEPLGTLKAPADLQGMPLIDTTPQPFEVAVVALTRDGQVSGLRPTKLTFPDPPLTPLLKLPGRELPREPRPGGARPPATARRSGARTTA